MSASHQSYFQTSIHFEFVAIFMNSQPSRPQTTQALKGEGLFSVCPSNFHSKTSDGDDENSTSQITRTNGPRGVVALKIKWIPPRNILCSQLFQSHDFSWTYKPLTLAREVPIFIWSADNFPPFPISVWLYAIERGEYGPDSNQET